MNRAAHGAAAVAWPVLGTGESGHEALTDEVRADDDRERPLQADGRGRKVARPARLPVEVNGVHGRVDAVEFGVVAQVLDQPHARTAAQSTRFLGDVGERD
eukprot:4314314-Prymnesium_polylepis.1